MHSAKPEIIKLTSNTFHLLLNWIRSSQRWDGSLTSASANCLNGTIIFTLAKVSNLHVSLYLAGIMLAILRKKIFFFLIKGCLALLDN